MAAPPTSWCTHYHRNQLDGGVLQNSFEITTEKLDEVTRTHTDGQSIMRTLNTLPYSTFFITPEKLGNVNFLHQGFSHASVIGEDSIGVFIHGNFDESPFKVLPIDQATGPISGPTGARTRGDMSLHGPSLSDMLGVQSVEEFTNLPQGNNAILDGRPNHFVVSGRLFVQLDGPRTIHASKVAFLIIDSLLRLPTIEVESSEEGEGKETTIEESDDDDQETISIKDLRNSCEALLTYLWVVANRGAPTYDLPDLPDDRILFGRTRRIRAKLTTRDDGQRAPHPYPDDDTPTRRGGRAHADGGDPNVGRDPNVLAIATQGLINTLSQIDRDQQRDRREDLAEKSLFRGLGPNQRGLFLRLSTSSFDEAPAVSTFMNAFIKQKHAIRAVAQLKYESRDWPGTFSESALQRFLVNGFVAQEASASQLGGFTVFMCYPKASDVGTVPLYKDKARIRDMLGLDQSEEVVSYFSRKSFYVASDTNELKIQLETCLRLLEKLTVRHSVAGTGLTYIIRKFDSLVTTFAEMFVLVPNFGALFLYSVDRALQFFFSQVQEIESVDYLPDWIIGYPRTKAIELMDGIRESRAPTSIVLPDCLRKTEADPPSLTDEGYGKRGGGGKDETSEPKTKKKKSSAGVNRNVEPSWKLPSGKTFTDYFLPKSENLKGWPTFPNPDGGGKNYLCIKFQVEGRCRDGCSLAHPDPKKMAKETHSEISSKFAAIYGA